MVSLLFLLLPWPLSVLHLPVASPKPFNRIFEPKPPKPIGVWNLGFTWVLRIRGCMGILRNDR